jgi:uncharacterized protein
VRIAIVGTGISGLGAAWLLARHHDVHVFEREARLGGHTNTVEVARGDGSVVPVDTGFIVYNEPTYPLFVRLFDELGVATQPSDMSWSLRCERCDLEYAGNLGGLVAQPRNLLAPGYLRMLATSSGSTASDVGWSTTRAATTPRSAGSSTRPGSGTVSATTTCCRWRPPSGRRGPGRWRPPARHAAAVLRQPRAAGVTTHHPWRTVVGGSSSYLAPLTAHLADRIHRGDEVVAVRRDRDGATLRLASGAVHRFDVVVVATHADEALGLLEDPSPTRRSCSAPGSTRPTTPGCTTTPRCCREPPRAWASWNYRLDDCQPRASRSA